MMSFERGESEAFAGSFLPLPGGERLTALSAGG
jgi:hypothetical protein